VSHARVINTIVARALVDRSFLGGIAKGEGDSGFSDGGWPQYGSVDHVRLAQLAAFVCKIQHNDLWDLFPHTLRMISRSGQELEVFGAYRAFRPQKGASLYQRAETFHDFLSNYMKERPMAFPGGRDLLAHEWLFSRVSKGWHDPIQQSDPCVAQAADSTWRPSLRGLVLVRAYTYDPILVANDNQLPRSGDDSRPPTGESFLCYVNDPSSGRPPRVFRADPLVCLIIACLNGARTPLEIAEYVGYRANLKAVVDVLSYLVTNGLVSAPRPLHEVSGDDGSNKDPLLAALTGHAVSRILYTLDRAGILEQMFEPTHVEALADDRGMDRTWLANVLEFVAAAGGVVRSLGDGWYAIPPDCNVRGRLGFELSKFVGAYGPCLDEAGSAPSAIGHVALADGFVQSARQMRRMAGSSTAATILREVAVASTLLDLGCGPGSLLVELAVADTLFEGLGVDASEAMCLAARAEVEAAGVSARVRILCGDGLAVLAELPPSELERIKAVHAGSFFNAMFGDGTAHVVQALKTLRVLLPGRILVISDYYGRLRSGQAATNLGWTLLQDLAQVCSGQGVPPHDRASWHSRYKLAGCDLLDVREAEANGYLHFVHVVRLGEMS
jgi:SAM-dependent methyltransferase